MFSDSAGVDEYWQGLPISVKGVPLNPAGRMAAPAAGASQLNFQRSGIATSRQCTVIIDH